MKCVSCQDREVRTPAPGAVSTGLCRWCWLDPSIRSFFRPRVWRLTAEQEANQQKIEGLE